MTADFNLPGSSFEELQKILKGYSEAPEQTSLSQLSNLTGIHTTIISRNNKFLADMGLITGGIKKTTTDLGKKLGRALDHGQASDAQAYWKEAIQTNEKLAGLVSTVRIRGGMSQSEFSNHVLYVSGQKKSPGSKTGARCVVDVLLAAHLLTEENDKLIVAAAPRSETVLSGEREVPTTLLSSSVPQENEPAGRSRAEAPHSTEPRVTIGDNLTAQIAINIQLHLPETENAEVYEKLFKALREHLFNPKV
jgi:hypothetical protein